MAAPKGHPPYPGCETGGRESPYTTEIIEKYADDLKEWLKDPMHVWFKDFALDNDFDPDYLSIWAKKNQKFSGAYKIAKQRQESRLVNGGLLNAFNSKIVSLLLSSCHGINEKKEEKHSFDTESKIPSWVSDASGESKDLVPNDETT